MKVKFGKDFDGTRCEVRVSDASMKTNGLVLVDKFTANAGYCINPGYYYIGCNGATTVKIEYMEATEDPVINVDLIAAPHWKVLSLGQKEVHWTTVPESHKKPDFDKSKPLTGKPAYPADPTYHGSDFTCDQKGYRKYLSKWTPAMKCTSRDPSTEEFQTRLDTSLTRARRSTTGTRWTSTEWSSPSTLTGIPMSLRRSPPPSRDTLESRPLCLP